MQYFNLILTNHALQRISERGLTKELAWETFNKSDKSYKTDKGSTAFSKKYQGFETTLVARLNEKGEWVALSFWREPPLAGTRDAKKREEWKSYKKAGFWGKLFITLKQQLGLLI